MAQNVIVPVIDLTSAAEGSTVPQMLQTALSFGSQTEFEINNGTDVIANTAGFWRIVGTAGSAVSSSAGADAKISMSDGLSTKTVWGLYAPFPSGADTGFSNAFDLVVFLESGDSVSAITNIQTAMRGSSRQIADVNGNLINPSGFNPQ